MQYSDPDKFPSDLALWIRMKNTAQKTYSGHFFNVPAKAFCVARRYTTGKLCRSYSESPYKIPEFSQKMWYSFPENGKQNVSSEL